MVIYRSPHPALDIPATPLADVVLARAAARGERAALVDAVTGRTITYAQLPGLVDRAAAALSRRGLGKGDVCAVFSANTPDYAIAVLAIARLGAIVTTASPMCTREDLTKQFADSRPRMLITSPALGATAIGTFGFEAVYSFGAMEGATPFEALLAEPGTPPAVAIAPGDVVALPYSSGTTGLPKGVMLTHRNLVANILQADSAGHLVDGADTLICFLPFFHIYGLVVTMLLGLRSGATLVVMPRFELEPYLDLVERYRATMLHVVPPIVLALAKSPATGGRDFSSVRKLFSGAAPLGADVIAQCTARVGAVVQQGYGLTETSPATHVTPEDPAKAKPGSIGLPVANTECRVVDPATREDVTPGQDGELWIRGPQVMLGYLNCPDATRATVDADGWLHTGDIGHADADGHFFIVDRLKELIKYKGMQIAPAELEAVLLSHPAVADAAVIPQKNEEAGEIPRAFVVLKGPASAEELMAYVAARVASYKKIRRLDFIDAIPKSPSGKILRRLLRDAAVAITALVMLAMSAAAQTPLHRFDGTTVSADRIDREAARVMAAAKVNGLAMAVIDDGGVTLVRTWGHRNVEKNLPLEADTVMYGASLTKFAFAYMVMQLVDERIVDLDRSIAGYLPKPLPEYEFYAALKGDERWRGITPRILLSHRSGLANYAFLEPDEKMRLHFEPGSRYAYSGEGIILLQFVLETGLGLNVGDEMQRRVFDRFGMTRTSMTWRPDFEANQADGYAADGTVKAHNRARRPRAAGSMDTTITNFAKFLAGFMRGEGLTPESRAAMIAPQLAITTPSQFPTLLDRTSPAMKKIALSAGLGVVTFDGPSGRAFFKGGHDDTTGNQAICVEQGRRCVVYLSNDVRAERVYQRLTEATLGDPGMPWAWESYVPFDAR